MIKDLPRHGTRSRYRRLNCRCVGCQRGSHNLSVPDDLRWPYRNLERFFGKDTIGGWFTPEQIAEWKQTGLTDADADRIAIKLGAMPFEIWDGWESAGLDYPQYP